MTDKIKVVIANLKPVEEKFDSLIKILKEKLPEAKKIRGCKSMNACIDKQNKTIILYEVWESEDDHKKYVSWRKETGVHNLISQHLQDRSFSYYTYLV